MILRRGITVSSSVVDSVILDIQNNGLYYRNEGWFVPFYHLTDVGNFFVKSDLSLSDTRANSGAPSVCACGDIVGAEYYAWKHNVSKNNDTPVIIEFDVDKFDVAVDGKDFLFNIFANGDPELSRQVISDIFGDCCLKYADKAWDSQNIGTRLALCDLAVCDNEVVYAHYSNNIVIGGRSGTIFRNAFIARLLIESERIIKVWSPRQPPILPTPDVYFADLLRQT